MSKEIIKNTSDLRKMLLDSIEGVRKGKMDSKQAQAISALSSRILQSARLDFDIMKLTAQAESSLKPSAVSLIGEEKKKGRPALKVAA